MNCDSGLVSASRICLRRSRNNCDDCRLQGETIALHRHRIGGKAAT